MQKNLVATKSKDISDIAIRVEKLSKIYTIGEREPYKTLRDALMRPFRKAPFPEHMSTNSQNTEGEDRYIWALKDVSFEVRSGEVIGIIGNNGAGKSTLLKILSRITSPTEGYAEINGRVGSLLEVGTGFHPELTGRENIYLSGALLGLRKKDIDRKFREIVEFSEVEKFIETPIKYYSSGMKVRLAFAVAAHLEPEILLIDEVLAVGDVGFQKKCMGRMGEVTEQGRTILFVSHNMRAIKSLCTRCILLEQGSISMEGPAPQVVDRYMTQSFGTLTTSVKFPEDSALRIQVLYAELLPFVSDQGEELLLFKCQYVVRKEAENVLLCVEVRNTSDVSVFYSNDSLYKDSRKRKVGIHWVTLTIPKYLLAPGDYFITFGFWEPGRLRAEHFPDVRLMFRREEPITRLSAHGVAWPSVIYMPTTWKKVEDDSDFEEEDET